MNPKLFENHAAGQLESGWLHKNGRPYLVPMNTAGCKAARATWSLVTLSVSLQFFPLRSLRAECREQHVHPIALIRMHLETGLKHQLRLQASNELRGNVTTVLLATVPHLTLVQRRFLATLFIRQDQCRVSNSASIPVVFSFIRPL